MTDRVTANLPSNDFDRTAKFYEALGFRVCYRGDEWMILERGSLVLEFFLLKINPRKNCHSACIRVDDLDALYEQFRQAGLPDGCRFPWMSGIEDHGMRVFNLADPDGSLLRCIDNRSTV